MNKKRYFYHGIKFNNGIESLKYLYNFLLSGSIKSNNNYICLYKKNDDFDYNDKDKYFKSARDGWIDNCVVFVVSSDVVAKKFEYDDSLIDEWRTNNNDLSFDNVVGIAFPNNFFKLCLENEDKDSRIIGIELIQKIYDLINSYGWFVTNSSEPNFTDQLDDSLNKIIK